ncbi:ATP/GTP-binding protein (plasmid) [Streptomyces aureoverticillatus]|nr:ATP/GTP-binding protein [Streptomyces aureoverticillatus]
MDPQPPPGSMYWEDQKSGKGRAVYSRTCNTGPDGGPVNETFVGGPGQPAVTVDPAVVAQQAVDKMKLSGPDIASPRADGTYVVGVPMWLWVRQSPTTFGPNTATATAGGVTVTATAKVKKVVWRMGDGGTQTCAGPGTPYKESYGMKESPTCGHRYTKTSAKAAGRKFALTATSTWSIDWQVTGGGGEAGELTEVRQSQAQVAVGEVQVVG